VKSYLLGSIKGLPPRSERPRYFAKLAEKYGGEAGATRSIIGPTPVLQVCGPRLAREVFSSSKHSTKGFFYVPLRPWLGLGLLTASGEKWKIMRRLTTPAFHFEVLHRFLDVMNEQSEVMIQRLGEHAGKDEIFDVFDYVTACALDIVCETAMGKKVNAQAVVGHTEYVEAVYNMSKLIVARVENPLFISDFIYNLSGSGRRAAKNLKVLHDFTNKVIRERKALLLAEKDNKEEEVKRRPAFLDILIHAQATEEHVITDENIREEVDTFMFEGLCLTVCFCVCFFTMLTSLSLPFQATTRPVRLLRGPCTCWEVTLRFKSAFTRKCRR